MNECRCSTIHEIRGGDGEDYARTHLSKVVVDDVNWQILWRCPVTGRYWKEYFPHSEAHGGGPPDFVQISEEEAKKDFNIPEMS